MENLKTDTEKRLHSENLKPKNDDKFYSADGIFTRSFNIEHWPIAKLGAGQYIKILNEAAEVLDIEIIDITGQTVYIA